MTLILTPTQHQAIITATRDTYPQECCGMIVGHRQQDGWIVDRIVPSDNLSPKPLKTFEVDMRLRLALQRQLRGSGKSVIGHYHSHPGGTPTPSATDLESAWEDEMVWVIVGGTAGKEDLAAFVYSDASKEFTSVAIAIQG
jgi:proteasome lid subunit RPN8/RPN11